MKRGLGLALVILAAAGCGKNPYPDQPPGPVGDFANVLDGRTRDQLAGMILTLRQGANLEVAVATVASLGGVDDKTFAENLYKRWHLGLLTRARGVLILIAPTEKVLHITVGAGAANDLPDQFRQAIVDRDMVPAFSRGNYPAGTLAAVSRLMQIFRLGPGPAAPPPGDNGPS